MAHLKVTLGKSRDFFLPLCNSPLFRSIYGSKYEDGKRKSRINRELEELSKGENIVK
jgi:hypothetical protein